MAAIVGKHLPPGAQDTGKPGELRPERAGLSGPVELSVTGQFGASGDWPMTTAWVSDDLLAHTIDVWSRAYGRPVTTQEAMEILMNVKRFAELLIRAKEEDKA